MSCPCEQWLIHDNMPLGLHSNSMLLKLVRFPRFVYNTAVKQGDEMPALPTSKSQALVRLLAMDTSDARSRSKGVYLVCSRLCKHVVCHPGNCKAAASSPMKELVKDCEMHTACDDKL